jgi:TRAP-type mannitol/chloroaromatic compound transport system permease small subunit
MAHDIQPPSSIGIGTAGGAPSPPYLRVIRVIDTFTERTGKVFAWMIFAMVGTLVFEVVGRYFFSAPTIWAYDTTYILYGTFYMVGAAYCLLRKSHIRTDLLYRLWSAQWQGRIDFVCYLFLFFPGMILFLDAGWDYAARSWIIQERAASAWGVPVYPFKMIIPIAAVLILVQGVSEFLKSYHAARRGEWL